MSSLSLQATSCLYLRTVAVFIQGLFSEDPGSNNRPPAAPWPSGESHTVASFSITTWICRSTCNSRLFPFAVSPLPLFFLIFFPFLPPSFHLSQLCSLSISLISQSNTMTRFTSESVMFWKFYGSWNFISNDRFYFPTGWLEGYSWQKSAGGLYM